MRVCLHAYVLVCATKPLLFRTGRGRNGQLLVTEPERKNRGWADQNESDATRSENTLSVGLPNENILSMPP